MKFTAKEDFKHGHKLFEAGNKYDSEKQGLSDDDLDYFHDLGWITLDGKEDKERNPSKVVLTPGKVKIETAAQKV